MTPQLVSPEFARQLTVEAGLNRCNYSGSLGKSAIPGWLSNASGSGRNARPTFRCESTLP